MPFNLSFFHEAVKSIEEKKYGTFTSLTGSSGALLFAMIKGPHLLICSSESSAAEFYSDAVLWSGLLNVHPPVLIPPEGSPERLKNLVKLYSVKDTSTQGLKVIASMEASLPPIWNEEGFNTVRVSTGAITDRDNLIQRLYEQGYLTVPMVSSEGEMSIRGGILDIFPPDRERPLRVEFFGDEIESLRFFDIDTQLSIKEIHDIFIPPAIEPEDGPNLLEYLSGSGLIFHEQDDIKKHYSDQIESLQERGPVSFTSLPLEGEGFHSTIESVSGMRLLREERSTVDEFITRVSDLIRQYYIIMVCSSDGQAKRLKELFFDLDIEAPIMPIGAAAKYTRSPVITTGELSRGFKYDNIIVLTSRDIFGSRPAFRASKKSNVSNLISSIEDFKIGDHLVHIDHGIGTYLGIKKEKIEDHEDDFLIIEFLGGDKLFVPLDRINSVQKYDAAGGVKPRVDKLGGKTWQKTKQRVKKKVKDIAEHLIKIYAARTTATGHAFSEDTELHSEFDGFFPYEATPDQITSINEIKADMEKAVPMDRLLCGDVGYGKTEVVMRASFKAVYDSRQVAILAPTTILAEQHYETFTDRFSAFPVKIDYLSRFKTRPEQKKTLEALKNGDIDIIIGTHRLLAKDVEFSNLGLLAIDEEHKFGVAHKEKIKSLKSHVDILTLTATPIPRTLHMSLSGIRGMSTIETPPEDRMAVKSSVTRFNQTIIKEAIQYELDRNGQAFFVHNRIKDIYEMGNFIHQLVPDSKIGIAHGQMHEKELESVMHKFFHKEINVLVSTSIISSGLDIPTANTIIINRSDRFGLADLYQLRGRVGRSYVKAYAYFIIPGDDIISEDARKKLQAIQEMGYLGAGFRLALKDLEIRGAGNLLGAEQSGHIGAVGFKMYMEMLEAAVAELKGEKAAPSFEPVIELNVTAAISDEYIEDPDIRLSLYRKIGAVKDVPSLRKILDELKDRFTQPPEEAIRLIDIMELKILARNLFITRIDNFAGRYKMLFAPETPTTPEQIFALHTTRKGKLKFLPEGGIEINMKGCKWHEIFGELKSIMEELQG